MSVCPDCHGSGVGPDDWSMGFFLFVINVVGAKDNEFKFAIALCFRVIKLACLKSTKCWHIFL